MAPSSSKNASSLSRRTASTVKILGTKLEHLNNSILPTTYSSYIPSSKLSKTRTRIKRRSYHTCTIAVAMSLLTFYIVVLCISFYNVSKVNDPCFVAKASMEKVIALSSVERIIPEKSGNNNINTTIEKEKEKNETNETNENNGDDKNSQKQKYDTEFQKGIPKIIHQQWKDDTIPPKFMKWHIKWLQLFPIPEYKHMLWTDETGRQLIETHYPWFLQTYDNYAHNINRADAVRYFILYHYGGIYADLDYEPIINFYDYLPSNQVGLIESPYYWNENTQNSLMTSPKGDPFWTDLFTVLVRNANLKDVLVMTGPSLVDDAIEVSNQPTYILPCENFHRVPLGEYNDASITTIVGREVEFRLKPHSKQCGVYKNDQCHFGKHHNTVSYRNVFGTLL